MGMHQETPYDRLWKEYATVFRAFDDLTLARWLAQTLGQFEGRVWRLSHPLVGGYRLAAQIGQDRQVWLRRLATAPQAYPESPCCRSPLLPLLTRDVKDEGLVCEHCGETLVPFTEIPESIREPLGLWAQRYAPIHDVAHWDDARRARCEDYNQSVEQAAKTAARLLVEAGQRLAPQLLEFYPAVIWEDHDECLEVPPEEIQPR